jgi:hypothetical protein
MAFGFKVNNDFLDLYPGSTVSFVKNTELWVTGDPTINEGSYTFPVDVPLNEKNKRLLGYPDRIDRLGPMRILEDVTLYIGHGLSIGIPYFSGKLYIKESTRDTAKVFMTTDGLNSKKDIKFADVNIGEYNIPTPLPLPGLMNLTTLNPLDYDFIFFPVRNDSLTTEERIAVWNVGGWFHNAYSENSASWNFDFTGSGLGIENNNIITPFLRLEVIIEKVCEALGYTFVNNWLLHEEQRLICIYNNKSISSVDDFYYTIIRYNEHLPSGMTLTDFLIKIAKWQFVGLFIDEISKTITMTPYRDVVKLDAAHDWSSRALRDYNVASDTSLVRSVGYSPDSSDAYSSNNYGQNDATLESGAVIEDWFNRFNPIPPLVAMSGYYLSYIDRSIRYRKPGPVGWSIVQHIFKSITVGGQGADFLSDVVPLFDFYDKDWRIATPRADIRPTMELRIYDEDDELIRADLSNSLNTIRPMIYRGMRTINQNPMPYANSSPYDPANEADTFEYSLHYDGEKGIYERYGREWLEFLKSKKIVKQNINLKLQDILNFREWHKVRIENMNYFVKSMKITVTQNGIQPTECELVTIPFN